MASEAKPPILAAPLEIRLEIYRYAWTISIIDAERRFEKATGYPGYCRCKRCRSNPNLEEAYFKVQVGQLHTLVSRCRSNPKFLEAYLKLQVGQLHALVSICRQIRDEVLLEYFHRTQVYNRDNYNERIAKYPYTGPQRTGLQSSPLFASHTQHVSLHCVTGELHLMTRTLDWLLQLKQLKTLELVIIDWSLPSMNKFFGDFLDSSLFQRLTTLRNLEKIVVKLRFWTQLEVDGHGKVLCDIDRDIYGMEREVERTPQFQKFKEILSESVREDLRQPEQQPTYVFEKHIGHGVLYSEWPLSYRI